MTTDQGWYGWKRIKMDEIGCYKPSDENYTLKDKDTETNLKLPICAIFFLK